MTKTVTLGEICKVSPYGFKPNGSDEYYVGLEHIEKDIGRISIQAKEEPITTIKNRFRSGEILYGKLRPYLNKATLATRDGVCSTDILVLRPTADISPSYLLHYILSSKFVEDMSANVAGANLPRVSTKYILNYPIPLPPLPEQRRIAALLDLADALRQKDRQLLAHYDTLAQSVFLDLFGDPVRNEKGWEVKKIGKLGDWQSGGTPLRSNKEYFQGAIPWFSSGELNDMYIFDSIEHITEEAIKKSAAKRIKPGSLLLGMYDTAALKSSIAGNAITCNQAIAYAKLDDGVCDTVFVYKLIQMAKEEYKKGQRGVRQKNMNLSMIKDITIISPPLPLQTHFASVIEKIERQKAVVRQQMAASEALFGRLLQESFP